MGRGLKSKRRRTVHETQDVVHVFGLLTAVSKSNPWRADVRISLNRTWNNKLPNLSYFIYLFLLTYFPITYLI